MKTLVGANKRGVSKPKKKAAVKRVAKKVMKRTGATNKVWAKGRAATIVKARGSGPGAKSAKTSIAKSKADTKAGKQYRKGLTARCKTTDALTRGGKKSMSQGKALAKTMRKKSFNSLTRRDYSPKGDT